MRRPTVFLRKRTGFTLIELLLSLSLFSVVAVTVYGTFSAGLQLNRRSNVQNDIYREARWSLELLKKDLENAVGYDFSGSYEEERRAFFGEEGKISFLLPTEKGLKLIRYYLMSQENDRIHREIVRQATSRNVRVLTSREEAPAIFFLVREEIKFVDYLSDENAAGEVEVIASSVKPGGLKFYYYDHGPRFDPEWQTSWEHTTPPMAVYTYLEFLDDSQDFGALRMGSTVLLPANHYQLIREADVFIN